MAQFHRYHNKNPETVRPLIVYKRSNEENERLGYNKEVGLPQSQSCNNTLQKHNHSPRIGRKIKGYRRAL